MSSTNSMITNVQYNVCIDNIVGNDVSGKISHCYIQQPIQFESFIEMLISLEKEMNRLGYPQVTTQERLFIDIQRYQKKTKPEELKKYMSEQDIMLDRGEKATFVVEIKYRENSTWQGSVNWIEGNRVEYFRSALELLRLMDNAGQNISMNNNQ